ncbi:phasin family protein [Novosphingobium chloroacetimidivorans]|uniref:Phasin family protein n=1 Tax=Novosphingobium chloroacetimidivorans TaxID=1428314 RepID=A0A7W7K7E6_9SPHN|nr:phasin family protein [Novosphingobium chloroacetimidivorans]MBB4857577.1 phasin family protein [Novosphingobium chloroacetimidivorans]
MADTDDKNDNAASAQGSAVELSEARQTKPSLRRRVIAPDQTALSSAVASLPLAEEPKPDAPTSEIAGGVDKPVVAKRSEPELASPSMSVPKPGDFKPSTKPKAAKPLSSAKPGPIAKPTQPVAAKPLPPRHVAATKSQPAKVEPERPTTPRAPQPFSAAMPAVAPARTIPDVPIAATATSSAFKPKDKTMDMSANFSSFQDAISDAQAKAQAAFEKSSTVFGEVGEFAKGNVEAVIASGKILAEGVQEIGSTFVAEGRTAFESMTGDIKELAAAKSPTDFLKLQSDMVRKNFDSAVAYSSKNSETFLKLMNDAFAPISGRVSLAVEKARQVAPQAAAPVNTAAI